MKSAEDIYFIKNKTIIIIIIFNINKDNYKAEIIDFQFNIIIINNILFKSSLL